MPLLPPPPPPAAVVRAAIPPLTGVVRDSAGRPMASVDVAIPALQRQTVTDEHGRFAFGGVPPGAYQVLAFAVGYAPARAAALVGGPGAPAAVTLVLRPTPVRLEAVQVTATPTGTDPLRLTQSALTLGGRALDRALGASVATTLAGEPGVAQRFNGPVANMPVIRGLTGERILVLQDGQRAGDLAAAAQDHAVTIDPLGAQRIEVVRGPASLLYGTQALGGVVNVISNDIPTQVPGHVEGTAAAQAESVSPGGAGSVRVLAPVGAHLALLVRGTARSAQDFRPGGGAGPFPGTAQQMQSGAAGLGFTGARATGGVVYRGAHFRYGLPAPPGSDDAGARIRGDRQEVVARADVTLAGPVPVLRLEGSTQWYGHDEVEPGGVVGTRFGLHTQTLNATARTRLGRADGAFGAQGLFRQYRSTGEEALTPAADYANAGVFVFQELALGADSARAPLLQAGARYDWFGVAARASADPRFGRGRSARAGAASGSLGASVPLGTRATLGVSAARAFRAPTVEELYSNAFHAAAGTYDVGNPALRPEVNTGGEAVLRVRGARADGALSAYASRVDGFITPVIAGLVDRATGAQAAAGAAGAVPAGAVPAGAVPRAVFAQRDAVLRGVEGRVEGAVAPRLAAGLVGDLVRGRFADGGLVPFLPPARLGGTLRYEAGPYALGGGVRHAFAQDRTSQPGCGRAGAAGPAGAAASGAPCVDLATAAYTVVDLDAGVTFAARGRQHALVLRADNVGDARYFDAASRVKRFVANPGRNVSLVYRVAF